MENNLVEKTIMETATKGRVRMLAARVPVNIYDRIYKMAVENELTVTDVTITLLKGALKFMDEN